MIKFSMDSVGALIDRPPAFSIFLMSRKEKCVFIFLYFSWVFLTTLPHQLYMIILLLIVAGSRLNSVEVKP